MGSIHEVNTLAIAVASNNAEHAAALNAAAYKIQAAFVELSRELAYARGQVAAFRTQSVVATIAPPQMRSDFPTLPTRNRKQQKPLQPIVKAQMVQQERQVPPMPKTWAILVNGNDLTSEKVKEKILTDVSTTIKDVRIKSVRRTRDGGVTLETSSEEAMEKLKKSSALSKAELVLSKAAPPGRKLLIPKVPSSLAMEDLLDELKVRNRDHDITAEEFANEVKVISRSGADSPVGNVIVEVSERVGLFWSTQGGVDIYWRWYPVRNLSGVELCFKCFGYRHGFFRCTEKEKLCKQYGQPGHLVKDCSNAVSCRNCRLTKKPDGHAVNSLNCPFYKSAHERYIQRLNVEV